jgi:predicted nucleic acid-binding protein
MSVVIPDDILQAAGISEGELKLEIALLVAKRRRLIPSVKPVMDDLIAQAGFRVSNQLYADVLQAAGE